MRILIVDDEPHIRQMMRLTLEASGHEVSEAGSGEEGLARFGDGRAHDVVILDQKMPGLDGLGTLERIKERAPDARVLMVTAFASIELAVDAMRLGATDFLRKPMTPEMLRSAVAAAASEKHGARPPRKSAASLAPDRPRIETLTLNGFQIIRESRAESSRADNVFRVHHVADGAEFLVTVSIDPEAVERVARLTGRRLEPRGAFWCAIAERLLSAYVWSEARGPADGRLTVRDISREDLDTAGRWEWD